MEGVRLRAIMQPIIAWAAIKRDGVRDCRTAQAQGDAGNHRPQQQRGGKVKPEQHKRDRAGERQQSSIEKK